MKKSLAVLALTAAAAIAGSGAAQAQYVQAGLLRCSVGAGAGYVIGSQKRVTCYFRNVYGEKEMYDGVVSTVGVDLGWTTGGGIIWAVLAPSSVARGALNGNYAGAGAQATVALGIGANAMVGGFENSLMLQPVSVTGQTGLHASAGLAGLSLQQRPMQVGRR